MGEMEKKETEDGFLKDENSKGRNDGDDDGERFGVVVKMVKELFPLFHFFVFFCSLL